MVSDSLARRIQPVAAIGRKAFLIWSLILVTGYLFLGKGFAYFGVPPLYVAELGIIIGLGALAASIVAGDSLRPVPWRHPITWALIAFLAWQALETAPYLTRYGLLAVRDAVLWGYSVYGILIYLMLGDDQQRWFIQTLWPKLIRAYLLWLPIAFVFVKLRPLDVFFPGSPVPVLWLKSGDVGVHLAGVAAFFIIVECTSDRRSTILSWTWWTLWVVDWAAFTASNRGGMFAAMAGVAIAALLRLRSHWWRPLVVIGLAALTLYATGLRIPVTNHEQVSFDQLRLNVGSTLEPLVGPLLGRTPPAAESAQVEALRTTISFRLDWWRQIVDETVFGPFFWIGRGYGHDIAQDAGVRLSNHPDLRSPHNVFMTFLARSGVPGLLSWLVLLGAFGIVLVRRAVSRGGPAGPGSDLAAWVLAYWVAFLLNASFDVFLEGPMGGVLFWMLMGLGAIVMIHRTAEVEQAPERALPA